VRWPTRARLDSARQQLVLQQARQLSERSVDAVFWQGSLPAGGAAIHDHNAARTTGATKVETPWQKRRLTGTADRDGTVMDQETFWGFVERSRTLSDGSLDEQGDKLAELLSELDVDQVVAFDAAFTEASRRLYSWEHWGAATVMLGWCSDDTFTDFRSWVIAQGRATYERFVIDPDSIVDAGLEEDEELGAAERFAAVASEAYEELTGDDIWEALPDREGVEFQESPSGLEFDDSDAVLSERYPRLTSVYGQGPGRQPQSKGLWSRRPKNPTRND
jgi:hypothetical protein